MMYVMYVRRNDSGMWYAFKYDTYIHSTLTYISRYMTDIHFGIYIIQNNIPKSVY